MLNLSRTLKVYRIPLSLILGFGFWGISTFGAIAEESASKADPQPSDIINPFAEEAPLMLASFEPPQLRGVTSGIKVQSIVVVPDRENQISSIDATSLPRMYLPYNKSLFYRPASVNTYQLVKMGAPEFRPDHSRDFKCLVEALYFEARGETLQGQRAVAEVIINRVKSPDFPNTICGVVHQGGTKKDRCQFSYYCDGKPERFYEKVAYEQIKRMAIKFVNGHYPEIFDEPTHFHATHVKPFWVAKFKYLGKAGQHHFYSH